MKKRVQVIAASIAPLWVGLRTLRGKSDRLPDLPRRRNGSGNPLRRV